MRAQTVYNIQIGAWGDDASRGNTGVGVEIRTSIFPLAGQDSGDSFWVGDNLQNGAFIQFGYLIQAPGYYCLYGDTVGDDTTCLGSSDNIGSGDVRWFWEYWPNPEIIAFYLGIGPANSAGPDGTWHRYQIWPNVANGWDFVLDGQPVTSFDEFKVTNSKDPAFFIAEEVTTSPSASGSLGPVEFRNLSYLTDNYVWQQVTSLSAISACGIISPNCGIIPYGVTASGPNDIIAGTGQQLRANGAVLWPKTFMLTVTVPTGVQVTVDGTPYYSVEDLSLLQGTHSISVEGLAQVDRLRRFRFESWSDGSTDLTRLIDLNSDTALRAIYALQYKLVVISPFPVSGEGWYDQGMTAVFSTSIVPRLTPDSLRFFVGWYDRAGKMVTFLPSGSIVMDGSHTLEARWFPLYWPVLVTFIAGAVALLEIRKRMRRATRSEPVFRKEDDLHETSGHLIPTSSSLGREAETTVCRFCGGNIPQRELRCPECGMTVRYLGSD